MFEFSFFIALNILDVAKFRELKNTYFMEIMP